MSPSRSAPRASQSKQLPDYRSRFTYGQPQRVEMPASPARLPQTLANRRHSAVSRQPMVARHIRRWAHVPSQCPRPLGRGPTPSCYYTALSFLHTRQHLHHSSIVQAVQMYNINIQLPINSCQIKNHPFDKLRAIS